jgi:hypothetical protein
VAKGSSPNRLRNAMSFPVGNVSRYGSFIRHLALNQKGKKAKDSPVELGDGALEWVQNCQKTSRSRLERQSIRVSFFLRFPLIDTIKARLHKRAVGLPIHVWAVFV